MDIPAKATGELTWVHDLRVPGMLHGRVIRPPYAGYDTGSFVGTSLLSIDESSIAHLEGIVKVVQIADFVGVVAEREEQAIAAMDALKVRWKPWEHSLPDLRDIEQAIRDNPRTSRVVHDSGEVDAAWRMSRSVLPAAMSGPISCMRRLALPCGGRLSA